MKTDSILRDATDEQLGRELVAHGMIDMEGRGQETAADLHPGPTGAPGMIADLDKVN